jgi:hypothetical protein
MFSKLRKGGSLPEAPSGLGDFWVTVHVKFAVPLQDVDDPAGTPAQGYYRNFGVRCSPSEVPTLVEKAVSDGRIDWTDTKWFLVDPESLHRDVRKQISGVPADGIWYRSGRVLYADPDLEPQPS